MTTAFSALRNDDIRACLDCTARLGHAAGHERHLGAGVMGAGDDRLQILAGLRPGERDHARPQRQRGDEPVFAHVEDEEIEAEGLVRLVANRGCRVANLLGREVVAPERAKPARVRHRRNEIGRNDRAHAAQGDRMLDAEQVANRRADHHDLLCSVRPLRGSRRQTTGILS
jgi:hypothetical protein